MSDPRWKKLLPPDSFAVLFDEATERPGSSELNHEKRKGTFVCAACHLPLFSSDTKYESGTGWPSFYKPIEANVATKRDWKLVLPRTEYHCTRCGGPPGPRVQRRAAADRPALLQQRRRTGLRARGRAAAAGAEGRVSTRAPVERIEIDLRAREKQRVRPPARARRDAGAGRERGRARPAAVPAGHGRALAAARARSASARRREGGGDPRDRLRAVARSTSCPSSCSGRSASSTTS